MGGKLGEKMRQNKSKEGKQVMGENTRQKKGDIKVQKDKVVVGGGEREDIMKSYI